MIRSMTGFGRSEMVNESRKIVVEIKAVNHRYSEFGIKMPKKLMMFEAEIRTLLKEYIQRGKVDIFITYEDYSEGSKCLKYNEALAGEYVKHITHMSEAFGLKNDLTASSLSRYPEVLTIEEQTEEEEDLWSQLEGVIRSACHNFVQAREVEGTNLQNDLLAKLDEMLEEVAFIEQRAPQLVTEYREKLYQKMSEVLETTGIDENRILAESAIYADKICVDEELVRLHSHISNMRDTIMEGGSIGRKLDFIAQEMNREANTTLSKANDLELANHAINLKTSIEKVREQIQNIE
ncbi:MAG: YicC/YloC family endoribonuclease [Lachnospiraceae bacterium]